jgi:hypothetical protein
MASALAAVDMEDFTCHEAGGLKIQNGVDDVANFTHAFDRMESCEKLVGLGRVHGGIDNAR